MIIKYLNKLSPQQIKDQSLQLLGYSHNMLALDKFDMASCLANFANILEAHVSQTFSTSLKNSMDCMVSVGNYTKNVVDLECNNKESFIISIMNTYSGMFSCLIYRQDKHFDFVLLNKDKNYSFETYSIPKNKIAIICSYLGVYSSPVNKLEHPHDILLQYTVSPSNIKTFDVKNEYNSPFIDIENGLKYAYSNASAQKLKTLAFPIDNFSIHIKYLTNIQHDYPSLTRYINNLSEIYSSNELFRDFCANNPKASFEEKLNQFTLSFSPDLGKSLNALDLQNLKDNFDFFHAMCVKNQKNPLVFFASAMENIKPFLNSGQNVEDFKDVLDICKKYFPNISSQLSRFCAASYYDLANSKYKRTDYVNALKLYGMCLVFDPNHALAHYKKGVCFVKLDLLEQASECFKNATTLCPNFVEFRYNNAVTLYKLGNFKHSLMECNNILSIEPKHRDSNRLSKILLAKIVKPNNNLSPKKDL